MIPLDTINNADSRDVLNYSSTHSVDEQDYLSSTFRGFYPSSCCSLNVNNTVPLICYGDENWLNTIRSADSNIFS